MNTRSGAIFTQCTRRFVNLSGYGGSDRPDFRKIVPSARPSITTSGAQSFTARTRRVSLRMGCGLASLLAFYLCGSLLKKILDALLRLVVALRDRGGERFHHVAAGAVLFGDARQHIQDSKVR